MFASTGLRPRSPLPGSVPLASRGLLTAVVTAFTAVVLGDLFAVYTGVRLGALLGDGATAPSVGDLDAAYSQYERAGQVQVSTTLLCAVLFVTWFFLMRRRTGLMAPDGFRLGPRVGDRRVVHSRGQPVAAVPHRGRHVGGVCAAAVRR
ncbi:putative secreted protein [Streptomyces calvus]|uniref:hypothetical protein n=1 Tax=Streptomyces calvus TaxID=67282 RepID=UPI003512736A